MEYFESSPIKFESIAEEMNINIITDKFPGVKDLISHTSQPLFYVVKFWVRKFTESYILFICFLMI
jgi:hypothetical protein